MIFNYLKIALRSFRKNRISSFVNLFGLTVAILACLLILQYVGRETSYDSFHEQRDRLFRLSLLEGVGTSKEDRSASNYYGVAEKLTEQIPEIESFCSIHEGSGVVRVGEKTFREEKIYYADPNFFQFFSFPILAGQKELLLNDPNKIVITKKIAEKYFGKEDPLGKTIFINGKESFQVSGVTESPENSHFTFDFIRSNVNLLEDPYRKYNGLWNWSNFYIYMMLDDYTEAKKVEAKFASVIGQRHEPDDPAWQHILHPIDEIYLYSDLDWELGPTGHGKVIFTLLIIAVLILIIAWVNMVNLSTAQASERAKEVGIRKVSGASKTQLVIQFLSQALLMNLMALIIAVAMGQALKPIFESFIGHNIQQVWEMSTSNLILFILFFLIGVITSGLYPAFVLSGFKPVKTLKGKFQSTVSGLLLRKSLSIFQFSATIILIACTLMVYKQLDFMRDQNLGFDPSQTLVIRGPQITDSTFSQRANSFRSELISLPGVNHVATSTSVPSLNASGVWNGFRKETESESNGILMHAIYADADFIPTMDIKLSLGRNFTQELQQEEKSVLLNRKAIKALGYENQDDALNKFIRVGGGNDRYQIIGIINDYHQKSLKENINPQCIFFTEASDGYFSVKMTSDKIEDNVASVKSTYQQLFPGNPFDFFFLDESFNQQYMADQKLGRIIFLFSTLAILIACLGLFGLTTFTAIKKAKEIGIRKVLGAKISDVFVLISKEFISSILVAIFIATPVAYLIINRWLENYAYRASIEWWVFLVAAFSASLVAFLTMSYQGLKSAFSNPIDTLRDE